MIGKYLTVVEGWKMAVVSGGAARTPVEDVGGGHLQTLRRSSQYKNEVGARVRRGIPCRSDNLRLI